MGGGSNGTRAVLPAREPAYFGIQAMPQKKVLTLHTDKARFRERQKQAKAAFTAPANPQIRPQNSYTRHMYYGKDEHNSLIGHCFTEQEIEEVGKLPAILPQLSGGKYEPVNIKRQNYKKKMKAGVQHFVSYDLTIDGTDYTLKTKAIKRPWSDRVEEHPYSLEKKKTE